ncbi:MAG: serine protease [Bacteroidia bacterium]|nr:serine protease [Bacteroidia bacterium]
MELLNSLDPVLKTFWFIAIPTSLIFIIQTIVTFVGVDASDGLHADFDGDLSGGGDHTFQLFSLRNLINFLLGFSWSGISFFDYISNTIVLILVSFGIGAFFVYLFFVIIKQLVKLAEDNSFKITKTLNQTAEVYLSIPARKSGTGKIMISVNGSVRELDAITEQERIPTGANVRVVKIESPNLVVVETL